MKPEIVNTNRTKSYTVYYLQGRIGYGPHPRDFKGIVSKVTLGNSEESLENWVMYSMPLNDTKILGKYVSTLLKMQRNSSDITKMLKEDFDTTRGKGSFWYGEFTVPCSDEKSLDTFIKFPNGWRKGGNYTFNLTLFSGIFDSVIFSWRQMEGTKTY